MFVTLHELAHVGTDEIGHGKEFGEFFKFLLEQAIKVGVYNYTNYSNSPQEYCGINITKSPLL
jgi:hypothetical protein